MLIGGMQKLSLVDYPGKLACTLFTQGCNLRCPWCHNPSLVLPRLLGKPLLNKVIFDYLQKRRGVLEGVVITGGEPLIHKDLPEFIQELKNLGYTVKLDTNGTLPQALQKILDAGLLDYVAMDIKASPALYSNACAAPDPWPRVEQSLQLLRSHTIPYQLRTTQHPALKEQDVAQIRALILPQENWVLQSYSEQNAMVGDL
jgi:pyruvate formate lyase activating enzyme